MITFSNSLDPDQDPQNVSKPIDTLKVFLKEFFEKVNLEKSQQTTTKTLTTSTGVACNS